MNNIISKAPLRDRIIPWYFVLFFVVIASVDAVMVTLAVRSNSGLVTEHPYETGLAYNQVVNAANKQDKLGWQSTLNYRNGVLHFTLRDAAGKPLAISKATAIITRPTMTGMDFTAPLTGDATKLQFPAPGLWQIEINVQANGTAFQVRKRLVIQ
jgi:nitrogen fixation protein FixH